jgi:hypothetical protein
MRKSSVRGMLFSVFSDTSGTGNKKTAIAGGFWNLASDFVLLSREPAATPPPVGWNG